ncbi:MAG: hypothetical protein GC179_17040 [Anaerolineaceae bacterium]|nr:hypothetical protein [Anaerolineaceae bacterium]
MARLDLRQKIVGMSDAKIAKLDLLVQSPIQILSSHLINGIIRGVVGDTPTTYYDRSLLSVNPTNSSLNITQPAEQSRFLKSAVKIIRCSCGFCRICTILNQKEAIAHLLNILTEEEGTHQPPSTCQHPLAG